MLHGVVVDRSAPGDAGILLCVLVTGGLALIGGLAAACFTKAMGSVFLGEPRSSEALAGREVGRAMHVPLVVLALLCLLVALASPLWPTALKWSVWAVAPAFFGRASDAWLAPRRAAADLAECGCGRIAGGCRDPGAVRRRLLADRDVQRGVTWDCGYAGTVPRAQYTASSFVSPIVDPLPGISAAEARRGGFRKGTSRSVRGIGSQVGDVFYDYLYQPTFLGVAWVRFQAAVAATGPDSVVRAVHRGDRVGAADLEIGVGDVCSVRMCADRAGRRAGSADAEHHQPHEGVLRWPTRPALAATVPRSAEAA